MPQEMATTAYEVDEGSEEAALGKRLQWEEIHNHFNSIKYATEYENLAQVRDHLSHAERLEERLVVQHVCVTRS